MQISTLYKYPHSSNLVSTIASHGSSEQLPSALKMEAPDSHQAAEDWEKIAKGFQVPVSSGTQSRNDSKREQWSSR